MVDPEVETNRTKFCTHTSKRGGAIGHQSSHARESPFFKKKVQL